MGHTISICYPDKAKIEKRKEVLDTKDALEFFSSYPWAEQLEILKSIPDGELHYAPSVCFTNTENKHSLELTAEDETGTLVFSLWYGRPATKKVLFGILGEKEVIEVIDKWCFDRESSYNHLKAFLEEDYEEVERVMSE